MVNVKNKQMRIKCKIPKNILVLALKMSEASFHEKTRPVNTTEIRYKYLTQEDVNT